MIWTARSPISIARRRRRPPRASMPSARASISCAAICSSRAATSGRPGRAPEEPGPRAGEAARPNSRRQRSVGWAMPSMRRGRMLTAAERFDACVALCREHGFGRIEVANAGLLAAISACTSRSSSRMPPAVAQAAVEASSAGRASARRAERQTGRLLRALTSWPTMPLLEDDAGAGARPGASLGAARFERGVLHYLGKVGAAEDRRAEALDLVRGLSRSPGDGRGFMGPGISATSLWPWRIRRSVGRSWRRARPCSLAGSLSPQSPAVLPCRHRAASRAWRVGEAERYAAALEGFTRAEPLPWADFLRRPGARARGDRRRPCRRRHRAGTEAPRNRGAPSSTIVPRSRRSSRRQPDTGPSR